MIMILNAQQGLRIFDFHAQTKTAGPSPNNNIRAELFLLGCDKAKEGNPCEGCFNYLLWDKNKAKHSLDIDCVVKSIIQEVGSDRYITIGGGEPTDQIENLIKLCMKLKNFGFHIMVYSWRKYEDIKIDDKYKNLLKYIDILVDGEYDNNKRMYRDNHDDGFLSSIGSANQKIVDVVNDKYYEMGELKGLTLNKKNELIFEL